VDLESLTDAIELHRPRGRRVREVRAVLMAAASQEPEDGAYVAVQVDGPFVDLFHRDAAFAVKLTHREGAHWVGCHGEIQTLTWAELTELGPIAYVGQFVDRTTN